MYVSLHSGLTVVSPELRQDLSSIDGPVGPISSTRRWEGREGSGARWIVSTAVPVCLLMAWDMCVLAWLFVLLVSPRTSATRSIRSELRTLLSFLILGSVSLLWLVIGEPVYATSQGGYVPVHALVSYLLTVAVIAALLATYLWQRIYAKRHFTKAEWGSSLATLDAFDPSEDWAQDEDGLVVRAASMGMDEPIVTPLPMSPATATGAKGYDAPPPTDPASPEALPPMRLSLESTRLSPLGVTRPEETAAERRERLLREAEERYEAEKRAILAATANETGGSDAYRKEKRAVLALGDRHRAQEEYVSEKRRILSGEFGLSRVRSA